GTRWRMATFYVVVLLIPTVLGLWWMLPGVFSPHAYATREFDLNQRILTEGRVMVYYLRMVIAPWLPAMSLYHDGFTISTGLFKPATTIPAWALIAALLALAAWLRRRLPLVALGIVWFFAAQVLESSVWPLEIAYEHRVYVADWGIVLAVAALTLLRARNWRTRELVTAAAALAIVALALTTAWRAYDWRSNVALARVEASTHPHSPRATYLLSRIYTNLALEGKDKYLPLAYEASEKAARVHDAGLDPWVAMVLLAAQTGGDVRPEWFDGMVKAVGERPFTVSDVNALEALVGCVTRKQCVISRHQIERLFRAIDASPRLSRTGMNYANVLVTEANFIGYDTPAERTRSGPLLLKAANVERDVAQYQENVFNIALADHQVEVARNMLARVEKLNKLGKLDLVIADMQRRLAAAEAEPAPRPKRAQAPATHAPAAASSRPEPRR
ncbi:MAG TPA: hypothetical protein VFX38_07510, partial [Gammaproteobacteria bacterium]|nr:hypothetical protein [Gammaproteobacteria bacterium]